MNILGCDCITTPKPKVESIWPTRKKVAIVGWATSSRDQAPWDDESFDIWSCNELGMLLPDKRWDLWFDLHAWGPLSNELMQRVAPWLSPQGRNPDRKKEVIDERIAWLAKQDCPAFMLEKHPDVPNSIGYPFEEVFTRFGNYFTSTVAYQIALAIMRDYEEIHLYGIDMATDTEYWYQRPCVEHFLGIAKGMGKTVYVPPESSLFKAPFVYALEDVPGASGVINQQMIKDMLRKEMSNCEAAKVALYKARGKEELLRELDMTYKLKAGQKGLPIRWESL